MAKNRWSFPLLMINCHIVLRNIITLCKNEKLRRLCQIAEISGAMANLLPGQSCAVPAAQPCEPYTPPLPDQASQVTSRPVTENPR